MALRAEKVSGIQINTAHDKALSPLIKTDYETRAQTASQSGDDTTRLRSGRSKMRTHVS